MGRVKSSRIGRIGRGRCIVDNYVREGRGREGQEGKERGI